MTDEQDRAACIRETLLTPQGGRRRRTVDDHMYNPGLGDGYKHSRYRLQVFSAPDLRSVVVATQTMADQGPSLMNGAEKYAQNVWHRFCSSEPEPPIWLMHMPLSQDGEGAALVVSFDSTSAKTITGVRGWGPRITGDELVELVGEPVDIGRGQQVLIEPDPEPVLVLERIRVARLPRPGPDADRACRPGGISRARVLMRQVLPLREGRDCCWYHGGDWHEVSGMAIDLLDRVRVAGVAPEDQVVEAIKLAEEADWNGWRLEALSSLLADPIMVGSRRRHGHINGRHRTQAMLEAGVRVTVVGRSRMPEG